MEQVEVHGLRIAYERAGRGPPLVLAHGYVADGRATWRRQLEALADEFTVVAWDAPGAGGSSDPPEHFGMAGYADCLAAFVRELGFGPVHVAGISFGAALAFELWSRHPAVPESLVLVSAYAGWGGSLPAAVVDQRVEQAERLSDLSPDELVDALLPTMFSASAPRADVDDFAAAMRAFHPAGLRAMARALAEDLRDVPPTVQVRALLVHGENDERSPLLVAEGLRTSMPDARLVVLRGAGHLCNIDASEQFNRAVRRFLTNDRG